MRPTIFHVGGTLYWVIRTYNPDTLVLKDADSTPTVAVRKNGSSTGDSVTVTKRSATTGIYDCSYNPAGEVEGDEFIIEETATITGTTTAQATYSQSWSFTVIALERGSDTAPDNASITAIKAKTDNLPSDPADASEIADSFSTVSSTLVTIATYIDTEVAAIKAKTDNLPTDPADQSAVEAAITSAVSTIRGADNDTLKSLSDQIDGIDGGGGGTVNVLPATGIVADRSAGVTLTPVIGETISQAITVYQSDGTTAVDLSGKTLKVIFETMSGTDVAVVATADITISGTSSNIVTFAYPSAVTASERTLRFAIRDAAAPLTMYLQGVCSVVSAPKVDA